MTYNVPLVGEAEVYCITGNAIDREPENEEARRQSVYLGHAHISTVHSFCSYVIRNYFHTTGIDPSCRVMNDAERALLISEVTEELLNKKYEEQDKDLLFFGKTFFPEKNADKNIAELIGKIYEFASSAPWPRLWLEKAVENMEEAGRDPGNAVFYRAMIERADEEVKAALPETERLLRLSKGPGGPAGYISVLESDLETYRLFLAADNLNAPLSSPHRRDVAALEAVESDLAHARLGVGKQQRAEGGESMEWWDLWDNSPTSPTPPTTPTPQRLPGMHAEEVASDEEFAHRWVAAGYVAVCVGHLRAEDAEFVGARDGAGGVRAVELRHYALEVGLDRLGANAERRGDSVALLSARDLAEDVELARGEGRGGGLELLADEIRLAGGDGPYRGNKAILVDVLRSWGGSPSPPPRGRGSPPP